MSLSPPHRRLDHRYLSLFVLLAAFGALAACQSNPATSGGDDDSAADDDTSDDDQTEGYCDPVQDWSPTHQVLEEQVLTLTNQARAEARMCGDEWYEAAPPLTPDDLLRCAARRHSLDMAQRGFFSHVNPDGQFPNDRVEEAGYDWATVGENIAAGQAMPADAVEDWLASPEHCPNIMDAGFEDLGVGLYVGGSLGTYWTQVFALPK